MPSLAPPSRPSQSPEPSDIPATLSYALLAQGDPAESTNLLTACRGSGIFYLDINDSAPSPSSFAAVINDIYELSAKLFSLPQDELMRYDVDIHSPLKLAGYKPLGRNRAGLASNRDGFETFAIPKDGILNLGHNSSLSFRTGKAWSRPQLIDEYMQALKAYVNAIHAAANVILDNLCRELQLDATPGESRNGNVDATDTSTRPSLRDLHRASKVSSPDLIRLLHYPDLQPSKSSNGVKGKKDEDGDGSSHIAHTDLGSLTFLCTREWGLQIREPDTTKPLPGTKNGSWPSPHSNGHELPKMETNGTNSTIHRAMNGTPEARDSVTSDGEWHFIPPPPPNHLIVNIGDMLSLLTRGYLKSCLHRVVPLPGQGDRYSFVYLMRAENDVPLKPLWSPLWDTEAELGNRKVAEGRTRDPHEQREDQEDNSSGRRETEGKARGYLTSEQWLRGKFRMLRGETWQEEDSWILTGSNASTRRPPP